MSADLLITGRAWRDGHCVDDDVTLDDLKTIGSPKAHPDLLLWVDLLRPSAEDLALLGERLGLPATALEDALAPHERPKVTRHDDHLFFTAYTTRIADADRTPDPGHSRLRTSRISGFVLDNALITVRLDDEIDMGAVVRRWEDNPALLRLGTGALVHGLLDLLVDGHFATIERLDDELEELEDELFEDRAEQAGFVQRVYRVRKELVALRRVVTPMREVVNGLLRHRTGTRTELDSWFDDLYDHVLRAAEWTESLRDMVTSVFETNLSLQDARLNTIMKKLAGWAAIIAVPTAITGWFGQNVPYPGFSSQFGLWQSVVLIVVCSLALYVAFRRQDWL